MSLHFLGYCSFPVLLLVLACASPAAPLVLDIEFYRTAVSPGTVVEDLQILREIIPELARRMFPVSPQTGRYAPETLEFKLSTIPKAGPGYGVETESKLIVNGRRYQQAAETYLKWRKEYEQNWIQSNTTGWEPKAGLRTPLQIIFGDTRLDPRGKALAMLRIYSDSLSQSGTSLAPKLNPTPTPPPEFWPVSDIIEMPEVNGSVQINMRGGKVTVLDKSAGKATIIPFDSSRNPRLWLATFRKQALRFGLPQAIKMEQAKVPRISNENMAKPVLRNEPSDPVPAIQAEKPKPRIPWGE